MVLGNLPMPGRPAISMIVEQGPTALVVGAGGGYLDIFGHSQLSFLSSVSPPPPLWETARYSLKYFSKGR